MNSQESNGLTRREMLKKSAGIVAAGFALPHMLAGQTGGNLPIQIGILGAAHVHLERYARLLENEEAVQVKAIYDDTAPIARIAADLTGAAVANSLDELLGDGEIKAVIILSENIKHEEYAIAAAEAGKHMFVEKPLDIRGDRADRIAAAVARAGVIFQTGYFMQSMAQMRFLKDAMRAGHFGRVNRIRLQYTHGGSLSGMWDGHHAWMVDAAQVGRGALGDLGIHVLNALLWMTEGDPIRDISAYVGNATGAFDGIDEYGEAMLHFDSGLIATLGAGYVDRNDVNRIEITGNNGHAYMNRGRLFLVSPSLTGTSQERYWSDFPDSLDHPFVLFLSALRGLDVPLISAADAARDVHVMDDIYHAATGG